MVPIFLFCPPSPALRGVIQQHQIIRLRFGSEQSIPIKAFWPRPANAIAFYPRDREQIAFQDAPDAQTTKPRAVIIGQPTRMTWRQGGRDFFVYQIALEPGALYRLTGLPAHAYQDQHLDAEAVFAPGFRRLIAAIENAPTAQAMIGLAETYLGALLGQSRHPVCGADQIATQLLRQPDASLDRLAANASLSPRHMRRAFLDRVGVSPKLFARIARFDRVVRRRNRAPDLDWLSLAIDGGYYDHQHLAKDFASFTGLSPMAFDALEASAPERAFGFSET
jgi:AraC-like DNA-binding protein